MAVSDCFISDLGSRSILQSSLRLSWKWEAVSLFQKLLDSMQ